VFSRLQDKLKSAVVCDVDLTLDKLLNALLSFPSHERLSLLDSCGPMVNGSHLLIAAFDPIETIDLYSQTLCITRRNSEPVHQVNNNSLQTINRCLEEGLGTKAYLCIATLSYELVHHFERLKSKLKSHVPSQADATLSFYDTAIVYDYLTNKAQAISFAGEECLKIVCKKIKEASAANIGSLTFTANNLVSNFSREQYLEAIIKLKEHIYAGDVYQANLTQQFSCNIPIDIDPAYIFLNLRHNNPMSFSAFLRRPETTIISTSPERFLKVEVGQTERVIEAWPIKGTRPRGKTKEEDKRLIEELRQSEKDRAENIMIVDLVRNDLGRICQFGTVQVKELCIVEEHPTLFHLVSKICGVLRENITLGEIIRATFPCGSITGAPKIRAMEILSEIENVPRAISMGAIGYVGNDGTLDFNVAIRTMTIKDGVIRFNVGGGIVADSDPDLEYEESLLKARALFRALNLKHYP
jgi:para-aminobenzoate synthetase component I